VNGFQNAASCIMQTLGLNYLSKVNQRESVRTRMWNKPSQQELALLPKLYATMHIPPKDKIIYMHFFIGGCDWYVAEYDGDDLFFGFAILNDDKENAEWGYISLSELDSINIHGLEIDRDLHWQSIPANKIKRIQGLL
jgi:hypothetical protein